MQTVLLKPYPRSLFLCLILAGIFFFVTQTSQAQQKCGIEYFQKWQAEHGIAEPKDRFEDWMAKKLSEKRKSPLSANKIQETITVPVVVHIIHHGEAIGVGSNLSYDQILSQITVLNKDFRRTNADRVNTPELFEPVAADTEIQFVLAKRDPEGLATDGVTRVNGVQDDWSIIENGHLKNLSYWPAKDYLNIWVTNLANPFVGYAQFPVSDLDGLEAASNNPYTDGVIIDYRAFGSEELYPDADLVPIYNLGRTASHEIGHYFGLRHIWGDGDCSADDYCADTPTTSGDHANLGEPCTFPGPNTCSDGPDDLPDMFQNYMDYTNDVCMNLFTQDQKARMMVVLENSPRRKTLLMSKGGIPPDNFTTDLGIRRIVQERDMNCSNQLDPIIEIRNYGSGHINQAVVSMYVNGEKKEQKEIFPNLDNLETFNVDFNSVVLPEPDDYTVKFILEQVNETSDEDAENDSKTETVAILDEVNTPFQITFENDVPDNWRIVNRDDKTTWQRRIAPYQTVSNAALNMNFYTYEAEGEYDIFMSPVIDLSLSDQATLSFDVSYARYPGINNEGLMVTSSISCSDPIFDSDTLYLKTGATLSTVNSTTTNLFVPDGVSDWRTEVLDLSDYAGTKIRLAFVSINGFGNDLYIDNIRLDLGTAIQLESPRLVSCDLSPTLKFAIRNTLDEPLSSFDLELMIDNTTSSEDFDLDSPLEPGDEIIVSVSPGPLDPGYHKLVAKVLNTNGSGLRMPGESEIEQFIYLDDENDIPPIRENFDESANWLRVSKLGSTVWQTATTNYNQSATIDNSIVNMPGRDDWIVSPVLDFTDVKKAYLVFDQAYQKINDGSDILNILISTDCGINYDHVLFATNDEDLNLVDDTPGAESDWSREKIDLSAFAGQSDIRLAIQNINGGEGILYLDNIELFLNDPVVTTNESLFPNPAPNGAFNITLGLEQKQQIAVRVINMQGQVIFSDTFANTLNQTYSFNLPQAQSGVYLVQVSGETFSFVKRLVITRQN